ncbi:Uncharacterised protein [Oligella urethralis]|uniref:Uncharacterized protein n=2 Tax=Alcaligenaceae TaxID=506 RepID=A0A2X1WFC4_9BURK|nr:Uncharacterised protein [Oligella urethralis]
MSLIKKTVHVLVGTAILGGMGLAQAAPKKWTMTST